MGLIQSWREKRIEKQNIEKAVGLSALSRGMVSFVKLMSLDSDANGQRNQTSLSAIMGRLPKTYEDAARAYQHHPDVMACIKAISASAADIVINYYKTDGSEQTPAKRKPIVNDLTRGLGFINPFSNPKQFHFETYAYLELDGNAYWYLEPQTGYWWNLRPDRVEVAVNNFGMPIGYAYEVNNIKMPIALKDIVHHKRFNPLNDHYGIGTLISLALTIESDFFARSWNRDFYRNSARPDILLTTRGVLDDGTYNRIKEDWKRKFGKQGKKHELAILEGDGDVKILNLSQKDIDFIQGLVVNRDEILAAFGVPPTILGFPQANYATAKESKNTFYLQNVLPKVNAVWGQFNAWDLAISKRVFAAPDVTQGPQIMEALLSKLANYTQLVAWGIVNPNEPRRAVGLPTYDGGDRYYMQAGAVPVDRIDELIDQRNGGGFAQNQLSAANSRVKGLLSEKKSDDADDRWAFRRVHWKKFDTRQRKYENEWAALFAPEFKRQRDNALAKLPGALDDAGIKAIFDEIQEKKAVFKENLPDFDMFSSLGNAGKRALLAASIRSKADDDDKLDKLTDSLFDLDGEIDIFTGKAVEKNGEIVNEEGQVGIEDAGGGAVFDESDPEVIDYILDKSQTFAETVNGTTWDDLRLSMAEIIDDGGTIDEITEAVQSAFDGVDDEKAGRARTIARTETIGATNYGQLAGYIDAGATAKEWISSGDSDVRESHAEIDGEVVELDSAFSNGLYFPGDPGGSAEEVVNCRCTIGPVV